MPTVEVTRDGIQIDGQPFPLLGGQLHYFRYPRAEWRDQLRKARAGGVNTIDTVIPWNFHEPRPGEYDFAGDADLAHYLDLCAELGLYAIVRPGPYICAEWENGGFPAWLTALPGLELRVDNPVYLEHLGRWFDTLLPILAERQITRGGPVILCQIENEHWASGRYGHDDHQRTLARAAIERGIDVPQYTCMGPMDDWAEFRNGWSGIAEKLAQTRAAWPDNPMIVSELWSGWFDNWGASRHAHKTAAKLDMTLYQLAAVGSSGWSHWMWAGGTNFGYWGGRTVGGDTVHMTTSYDYDAPVSEYGGLTPKFFVARRHHLFMSTIGVRMASVLAGAAAGGPQVIAPAAVAGRGEAGSAPYRNVRAGNSAPAEWADFTATYLQNPSLEGQTHQVFHRRPAAHLAIEVEAGSIKPIFANLPLEATTDGRRPTTSEAGTGSLAVGSRPSVVLEYHTSRILGFWQGRAGDTLVLYGGAGEVGQLQLRIENEELKIENELSLDSNIQFSILNSQFSIRYWISERPTVLRLRAGKRPLAIVLLTTERAERWWPLSDGFVCGPDLVLEDGAGGLEVERRGVEPFYRIGGDGAISVVALPPEQAAPPAQHGWQSAAQMGKSSSSVAPGLLSWTRHAVAEASAAEGWRPIERPRALEELGCDLGYGWYRAAIELSEDRLTTIAAPWLSDRARLLVDGVDQGWLGVHPLGPRFTLPIALAAGQHELRLLADNLGRFNYGSNTGERKGLLDTLYWGGRQTDLTAGWVALWQEAVFAGEAIARARPGFVRADASGVSLANFAFQGPSVWLLREFEAQAGMSYIIQLTGDRNPGALFVNGTAVARFSRHHGGGYIKVDISQLVHPGANALALNIQNYAGAAWQATLLEYDPSAALDAEWSFRARVSPESGNGGEVRGDRAATLTPNSQLLTLNSQLSTSTPAFYRAAFAYDPAAHGAGPFKIRLASLGKGQIWLNGHNLGRYWNVGPQESYKLPAAWLTASNELLIFDEQGGDPSGVAILADALSSSQLTRPG